MLLNLEDANHVYQQASEDFEKADQRMAMAEEVLLTAKVRTLQDASIKANHILRLARSDASLITVEAFETLAEGLAAFAKMPRAARLEIPLTP